MILFYSKITGDIVAAIDGRVHSEKQLNCYVKSSDGKTGKMVIGWIKKDGQKIICNEDKFEIMKEFESISSTSPLEYKVNLETGDLEKKTPIAK